MALPVRRRQGGQQFAERWEPFRELDQLHDRTLQLMQEAMAGTVGPDAMWTPNVDIEETDDAWIIEAEVPGARKDDVNVEIQENEIAITGEIKERERKGLLRRRARPVGRFEFRVTLPGPASTEDVDANLDHGVLTVRIPKPEQARPRRIEVSGQQ